MSGPDRSFALAPMLAMALAATGCGRLGIDLLDPPLENRHDTGADEDAGAAQSDGAYDGSGLGDAAPVDDGEAAVPPSSDANMPDAGEPDAASRASCGNGVLEAGEACDDAGPSASCDNNCTFASCGDGQTNALAGEACDDGDQLASCSATCRAPTCRSGCTCEWYRGVRYMLCGEQLAIAQARAACEALGMRVVRIASGTEHSYLRLRTQQEGFGKFHLGASDSAAEGTWVWDDGTSFWQGVASGTPISGEYSAWAPGEPNAFVAEENCSEVQSLQGWNDCTCDQTKPVVCKETRDPRRTCGDGVVQTGEACDDGRETASCDADCSPRVCGDGRVNATAGERCDDGGTGQYCRPDCTALLCPTGCSCLQTGGKTFALCAAAQSFRDAAVACGHAGMTLARIASTAVNQTLRSAATGAGLGEYWIGLFDVDQADHWLRSDLSLAWTGTTSGTAQGYTNFAAGAPSGASNQDCAAVTPSGTWQDRNCSLQKPYACEQL